TPRRYVTPHGGLSCDLPVAFIVSIERERAGASAGMNPFKIYLHRAVFRQQGFVIVVAVGYSIGHVANLATYAIPFIHHDGLCKPIVRLGIIRVLVEHFVAQLISERTVATLVNQE